MKMRIHFLVFAKDFRKWKRILKKWRKKDNSDLIKLYHFTKQVIKLHLIIRNFFMIINFYENIKLLLEYAYFYKYHVFSLVILFFLF